MKDILLALCGVGIGVALTQRKRATTSPTFTIDSRVDRAEMLRLMDSARAQTVAAVAEMTRRGGAYRKAVRG